MDEARQTKCDPPAAKSLAALDKGFRNSLTSFFRRRVDDQAEVDDLVQDVFLRLLRRGGLDDIEHRGGYVFETASSVLADRLRRRRTRRADQHESMESDGDGCEDICPERVLIGKEKLTRATAALLELPERTRTIFVLRRIEGMRYRDIAVRLGISVSAVEKHMVRAIEHLAERLAVE